MRVVHVRMKQTDRERVDAGFLHLAQRGTCCRAIRRDEHAAVADRRHAAGGQPAKDHREKDDEQQCQPEGGDRYACEAEQVDGVVGPRIGTQRSIDAGGNGDRQRQNQADAKQEQRKPGSKVAGPLDALDKDHHNAE